MAKATLLFEDMIRAETRGLVCRIWREQPPPQYDVSNDDLQQTAIKLMRGNSNLTEIVTVLVAIDCVNSVEVVDRGGNGICVHKDWP
jgi:hypothetical protein